MGTSVAFYFSGHPNFAANQSVTVMEIITFESKAYKELDNKITAIADYIFNHMETARQSEEDMWVDSYEVCTFLKISEKTLQRLRVSGTIAYSNTSGIRDLEQAAEHLAANALYQIEVDGLTEVVFDAEKVKKLFL